MYLIDTHLYKKKILDDKTLLTDQPSLFHYSPSNKVLVHSIEKDKEALPATSPPVLMRNKNVDDLKSVSSKDENNSKMQDSVQKNDNLTEDMDCDCSVNVVPVSQEKETGNSSSVKQNNAVDNYTLNVSKHHKMRKKKNKTLIPSSSLIKEKIHITSKQKENVEDHNSDDELRERLYRLRYDYQEPNSRETPAEPVKVSVSTSESEKNHDRTEKNGEDKTNYVCTFCNEMYHRRHLLEKHITENHPTSYKRLKNHKRKPSLTDSKIITFLCTICENRFKRFDALSRHMKNIHPEYFEEWNRTKKRKNEIPHPLKKKFKHDGRQKRKLIAGEENELKKVKKEYQCPYCERFYKSNALQRHINNLHTSTEKGEKRKNVDKQQHEGMYVKRKKGIPLESIKYNNYFK